jgi:hypothetical protein
MASPHDLPGLYPANRHCARRTESVRLAQPLYLVHKSCARDTAAVPAAHKLCAAYSVCTRRTARVRRAAGLLRVRNLPGWANRQPLGARIHSLPAASAPRSYRLTDFFFLPPCSVWLVFAWDAPNGRCKLRLRPPDPQSREPHRHSRQLEPSARPRPAPHARRPQRRTVLTTRRATHRQMGSVTHCGHGLHRLRR